MIYSVILVYSTAVIVGFQMESYTVIEDQGTLEVCVVVSGERDIDISVTLTTQGGTARGGLLSILLHVSVLFLNHATEWADFDPLSVELEFNPDTSEVCINIGIINDAVLEGIEYFIAVLTANDPRVIVSPGSATITIMDNDSE